MSMETKKIYIGSTSFDLEDVRAEICRFLEEECGHNPVYFESSEHRSTIAELEEILLKIKPEKRKQLMLTKYMHLEGDISLQIVDNKEMYVNERLPIKGVRGYESPMYKVKREILAHRVTFEHFLKIFEDTWNNNTTRKVDLTTTIADES